MAVSSHLVKALCQQVDLILFFPLTHVDSIRNIEDVWLAWLLTELHTPDRKFELDGHTSSIRHIAGSTESLVHLFVNFFQFTSKFLFQKLRLI